MIAFTDSRRFPNGDFVVILATYMVLVAVHGRLFNIDVVFYKADGGNWAVLGRFAAPELTGRLSFNPPIKKFSPVTRRCIRLRLGCLCTRLGLVTPSYACSTP